MDIPPPGVHFDVPEDDYHSWPIYSNSLGGVLINGSPADARYTLDHGSKSTDAMRLGTATHRAILEPPRFAEYVTPGRCSAMKSDGTRCTNEGKIFDGVAWWCGVHGKKAKAVEVDPETIITAADRDRAVTMRDRVLADPVTGPIFQRGRAEVTLRWDATVKAPASHSGEPAQQMIVPCKGRVDWLTTIDGYLSLVDIKKVKRGAAGPDAFARHAANYGYGRQAGMYTWGMREIAKLKGVRPKRYRYVFVVIEEDEPHNVAAYELADNDRATGLHRTREMIDLYAYCTARDSWPTFSEWHGGIKGIELPNWA